MIKRLIAAVSAVLFLAQPGVSNEQFTPAQNLPKLTTSLKKAVEKLPATKKKVQPSKLKMQLIISNPDDLKIYLGSYVRPGDLIMDRTSDRIRLESQLQELNFNYKNISSQTIPLPIKPNIPELPPISYAQEEAAINQSTTAIELISQKIAVQADKINTIKLLTPEKLPAAIVEHESAIAADLLRQAKEAESKLMLEKAKLKSAQDQRQYIAYEQQLNKLRVEQVYRQQLETYSNNKQNRDYQLAQIRTQIQLAQNQLAKVGKVKSSYYGQVSKIKYEGQVNEDINVSVTLDINDIDQGRFELGKPDNSTPFTRNPGKLTVIKKTTGNMPE